MFEDRGELEQFGADGRSAVVKQRLAATADRVDDVRAVGGLPQRVHEHAPLAFGAVFAPAFEDVDTGLDCRDGQRLGVNASAVMRGVAYVWWVAIWPSFLIAARLQLATSPARIGEGCCGEAVEL